jgi:hypothetical protein
LDGLVSAMVLAVLKVDDHGLGTGNGVIEVGNSHPVSTTSIRVQSELIRKSKGTAV